jgi:hypothetical protein
VLSANATYDKANRRLKFGATLTPELVVAQEAKRPPDGRQRSRISSIAGAGLERISPTAYRFTEARQLS